MLSLSLQGYLTASHTAANSKLPQPLRGVSPAGPSRPHELRRSRGPGRSAALLLPPPPWGRAAGAEHLQRGHQDFSEPTGDSKSLGPELVPNVGLQAAAEANRALLLPQREAKTVTTAWTPQPKTSYIGAAILVSHDSRSERRVTRKRPRRLPSGTEKGCGQEGRFGRDCGAASSKNQSVKLLFGRRGNVGARKRAGTWGPGARGSVGVVVLGSCGLAPGGSGGRRRAGAERGGAGFGSRTAVVRERLSGCNSEARWADGRRPEWCPPHWRLLESLIR